MRPVRPQHLDGAACRRVPGAGALRGARRADHSGRQQSDRRRGQRQPHPPPFAGRRLRGDRRAVPGPALGRRGAGRSGTCGSPLASAPQPGQETAPFTWRRQVGQKDVIGGFNSS
ncbi:hypothetical protein ACFQZC_34510 [Streptacidiphilus monticola]